ncbi:hypothetical protein OIO90_004295 [Microbotryomycetes sp. JL221]|nr:hypothetical protein OIO90_004295 [Microbotryomycetes sp. JL221]
MDTPVELWVYDLSHGMASAWGQMLTGTQLEGIWHTSLVLFDMEVFYGQGISIMKPGSTHHGQPHKRLAMGSTLLDKQTFLDYIHELRQQYTASNYHLLEFNCNTFTNDVLGFINGRTVPSDILDLPRRIMATPFGQQMRPMIDQMFRGGSKPEAQDAVNSLLPTQHDDEPNAQAVVSNLQVCSNETSFRSLLDSASAVAVMYTSQTCPPCHAIKPTFEQLARQHGEASRRIEFVIVDTNGPGASVARQPHFGGPITATPTFVFFHQGNKIGQCKGADKRELETQVKMLQMTAWPPHPHTRLALPTLSKLSHSLTPITYTQFPPLPTLSTKLESSCLSLPGFDRQTLTTDTIKYLSSLAPSPSKPVQTSLDTTFISNWTRSTMSAFELIKDPVKLFPIIDSHRLALARNAQMHDSSTTYIQFLSELLTACQTKEPWSSTTDKSFVLTLVRLSSNCLQCSNFVQNLLSNQSSDATVKTAILGICVRGLLSKETSVRTSSAGLTWSVVARMFEVRSDTSIQQDEEWSIELTSAIVESLNIENDSQIVHRLVASLALLLYQSPHYESLVGLLEVLETKRLLIGKKNDKELVKDQQVVKLIDEFILLISS